MLFLLACAPSLVDYPGDTAVYEPPPIGTWTLNVADDGLGTAMAWDGHYLQISAPFSGTLLAVDEDGEMLSSPAGAVMAAAVVGSDLVLGTPLAEGGLGLLPNGSPGQGGASRAMLYGSSGLLSLNGYGVWVAGEHQELGLWGSSVAEFEGQWVIGAAQGGRALLSQDGRSVDRMTPLDEAGSALSACDVDGDGDLELAVGAPGAGLVYIYQDLASEPLAVGTEQGRFGHALACIQDGLVIGAPGTSDFLGAVYLYRGELEVLELGQGAFGSSLLAVEGALFVAATGATADQPGVVSRIR